MAISGALPTIFVSNMDAAVRFYTESLGLKLAERYGDHWASIEWQWHHHRTASGIRRKPVRPFRLDRDRFSNDRADSRRRRSAENARRRFSR